MLDLVFPQPETVSEIRFRNWYIKRYRIQQHCDSVLPGLPFCHRYTARLTLLVRFDYSVQSAPKREHLAWSAAAVSVVLVKQVA